MTEDELRTFLDKCRPELVDVIELIDSKVWEKIVQRNVISHYDSTAIRVDQQFVMHVYSYNYLNLKTYLILLIETNKVLN